MLLLFNATHCWSVWSHEDEEVLGIKAERLIVCDDLHMRQVLYVSANLVLAFDNQDAIFAQDAMGLLAGFEVKVEDGIMVLRPIIGRFAV